MYIHTYITRGACRERKGKKSIQDFTQPRTSLYRYSFAVSCLLSNPSSPSDILYLSVPKTRHAELAQSDGQPLRVGPHDRPGVIGCSFSGLESIGYVEVQQDGSTRVPPTCSSSPTTGLQVSSCWWLVAQTVSAAGRVAAWLRPVGAPATHASAHLSAPAGFSILEVRGRTLRTPMCDMWVALFTLWY